VFVVPAPLDARTGGSLYNKRLIAALAKRGWQADVRELEGEFPSPSAEALRRARETLAAMPSGTLVVVDGLAFSAMPDVVGAERDRLRFVALIHMPLAEESGLDAHTAAARQQSERRALSAAAFVVVTGPSTVATIVGYGVPRERTAVVMPGTDPCAVAPGSGGGDPHLLCVAALTPGKGHEILIGALGAHRHLGWRLTCAGSVTRAPATVERVRELVRSNALADRVTIAGELGDAALESAYAHADVFVVATKHETFGMAVGEALARGIPVVSTTTGEIAALVGPDAGILSAPDDAAGFAHALSRVLTDSAFRASLRAGALRARDRLARWDDAAVTMSAVLERATRE
jgi:glycosyltransferase involved in cell wall biosynthesis